MSQRTRTTHSFSTGRRLVYNASNLWQDKMGENDVDNCCDDGSGRSGGDGAGWCNVSPASRGEWWKRQTGGGER